MGVTGLWRLVEPAGKPVPVEALENKVLAVDISIWLHQVVKGYQDAKGAPLPNAHLIGLFQRLCKLLYFRIKPVFVFDGAFPELKKETIAKRQDSKNKYNSESERLKRELAVLLSKKTAIGSLLGKQISPTKKSTSADTSLNDDLFKLPALPPKDLSESDSDDEEDTSSGSIVDLHSVDLQSDEFKNMEMKEKYDLLLELKETRKMNSWGKLHTLPKKSDNFSDFQMQRLLKRRKVQECIEETEKEMGVVGMSLNDLESLLNEEGIDTKIESLPTRRIASNNNTRFLLISNVKEALSKAKERKEADNKPQASTSKEIQETIPVGKNDELEDDLEKAIKMSLECNNDHEPNTDTGLSKTDDSWTSVLTDTDYSYSEASDSENELELPDVSSAKAYIMQYSDYTNKAIDKIVAPRLKGGKMKPKRPGIDQILEDLYKEKLIIDDHVTLSSSDEESMQGNDEYSKDNEKDEIMKESCEQKEITENHVDNTQASIMFVENTEPDVISLDSSTEECIKEVREEIPPKYNITDVDSENSESTDDEFEEVPEIKNNSRKPIVELTLKVDEVPDEEDIFADVFSACNESNINSESNIISNHTINSESTLAKTEIIEANTLQENQEKHDLMADSQEEKTNKIIESKHEKVLGDGSYDKDMKTIDQSETDFTTESMQGQTLHNVDKLMSNDKTQNIVELPETTIATEAGKKSSVINEPRVSNEEPLSNEKLNAMVEEIQNEEKDLIQEKGRLDRIGRNISEQMTKEAQELLQIFGIPYIVAPMEAEAQCAFLESIKLTDGTITDDSDIWLFGGRTVYKNFFNQKKHVLQYLSDRIERSFNLTREQLILLALLVGSDYTAGVAGVGPVTALEILASFPFDKRHVLAESSKQARYAKLLDGLNQFKRWVRAGKRTDNTTLKKKLRNVTLSDDFPSMRVVQAYLEPNVEKSDDKFTWGELDITVLRDYAKNKFGWSQQKFDEIIKPVLARMKDRKNQKTLQDYFQRRVDFQNLEDQMSKRVKAAVQKMGPEGQVVENSSEGESLKKTKKRKRATKNTKGNEAGPSRPKQRKKAVDSDHVVKVVTETRDGKSCIEINIPKTDRYQEVIPQRENDKRHLLENKLKAIEIFRKTTIDRKRKPRKRRANIPKDEAELSEDSSSS